MRMILNEKIYNFKSIKSTASAYKKLANFSISKNNNKIIVEMSSIDKDIEPEFLKNEFLNYALVLNIQSSNVF